LIPDGDVRLCLDVFQFDFEHLDRFLYVLEYFPAQCVRRQIGPIVDCPLGKTADTNAPWFCNRLNSDRYVDAVSKNPLRCGGDLTQIDADSEENRIAPSVPYQIIFQFPLKFDSKPDGLGGTVENGQYAVAGNIGHFSSVILDQIVKKTD
jgi:hypothetical protein